ncbi:hypothetical protein CB1_001428056 [Camelus ferus]|nr:hypothetical protein CB1_001428056 [Camelus ferus]
MLRPAQKTMASQPADAAGSAGEPQFTNSPEFTPYLDKVFFIVGALVFVVFIVVILSLSLYKCRKARAGRGRKESAPLTAA